MRVLILFLFLNFAVLSQNCSSLNFQLESEIASTCSESTMTMLHDQLGRNYLYVANKEAGLKIYNIADISNPLLIKHIQITDLANLDLMNLSQNGDYLYLALGNSFSANQASGMAIVNVSNPSMASVTDTYVLSGSLGGSGIVLSDNSFAYLAAMGNGILVLNVTDKNNISLESQFIPDTSFPDPTPDLAKINARGLALRNDTLFLCYDAGGFRIIDATNKQNLQEIGHFSNPVLDNLPRAYNNIVLENNLAYIAVDYCGVEVIDFSNPQNPSLYGWWNPYNCPGNNWFSSPVHANEIKIKPECDQLFVSTGKSDMLVLDISDPSNPDSCNFYGGVANNIGTWGIDVFENQLFLSYVCAIIPFSSNWTGFKALTFSSCSAEISEKDLTTFQVDLENKLINISSKNEISTIKLFSILGEELPFKILKSSENEIQLKVQHSNNRSVLIEVNGSIYKLLNL